MKNFGVSIEKKRIHSRKSLPRAPRKTQNCSVLLNLIDFQTISRFSKMMILTQTIQIIVLSLRSQLPCATWSRKSAETPIAQSTKQKSQFTTQTCYLLLSFHIFLYLVLFRGTPKIDKVDWYFHFHFFTV